MDEIDFVTHAELRIQTTRQTMILMSERKNDWLKTFANIGAKLWNALPDNIQNSRTIICFKGDAEPTFKINKLLSITEVTGFI